MIIVKRYNYTGVPRGKLSAAQTANGRALLAYALRRFCGKDLRSMEIAYGTHGKPYFSQPCGIEFSISHSGDFVAVMLGDRPLGVDIQIVKPVSDAVIRRTCSESERDYVLHAPERDRAFIRLWTLKESYIKATGDGMSYPMNKVSFTLSGSCRDEFGSLSAITGEYLTRDMGEYVVSACALAISG